MTLSVSQFNVVSFKTLPRQQLTHSPCRRNGGGKGHCKETKATIIGRFSPRLFDSRRCCSFMRPRWRCACRAFAAASSAVLCSSARRLAPPRPVGGPVPPARSRPVVLLLRRPKLRTSLRNRGRCRRGGQSLGQGSRWLAAAPGICGVAGVNAQRGLGSRSRPAANDASIIGSGLPLPVQSLHSLLRNKAFGLRHRGVL